MDVERYCRDIETYLCRKNDGHLIRIVGPSFELVTGWATRGIPLRIACRGIDRYFERYYAKGPRRRPVRIDFCEADVLDAFDEWRRTVGVGTAGGGAPEPKKRASLTQHVERAIARLTARRAGGVSPQLDETIDRIVRELDASQAAARTLRGEARESFVRRLEALDRELLEAAREAADAPMRGAIDRECDEELAAFRQRMSETAYDEARTRARDRLLREQMGLPTLRF